MRHGNAAPFEQIADLRPIQIHLQLAMRSRSDSPNDPTSFIIDGRLRHSAGTRRHALRFRSGGGSGAAEGGGFEPPRALKPYPLSRRAH
jgi:hypothetical protein